MVSWRVGGLAPFKNHKAFKLKSDIVVLEILILQPKNHILQCEHNHCFARRIFFFNNSLFPKVYSLFHMSCALSWQHMSPYVELQ